MFDHEKLDVYQLSLHFLTWVTPLLQEIRMELDVERPPIISIELRCPLYSIRPKATGNDEG